MEYNDTQSVFKKARVEYAAPAAQLAPQVETNPVDEANLNQNGYGMLSHSQTIHSNTQQMIKQRGQNGIV